MDVAGAGAGAGAKIMEGGAGAVNVQLKRSAEVEERKYCTKY